MNRAESLSRLSDPSIRVRLDAARHLVRSATPDDGERLREALSEENVAWIRSALERALARAERADTHGSANALVEDAALADGIYAEAVVEVTGELLHELEPLLGILRVRLGTEWPAFQMSKSAQAFDRVELLMDDIRDLNTASRVPTLESVELAECLVALVAEFGTAEADAIATSGPELVVRSNRGLLQTIVRNALRNALDASSKAAELPVLTWGGAGDEFFIAVLDSGTGPPAGLDRAFDTGRSTKEGHLGMGLAIADRAATALGGKASLRRRPEGGAVFEYRGPVAP